MKMEFLNAIVNNNIPSIVQLLPKVSEYITDDQGYSPLHIAAYYGDLNTFKSIYNKFRHRINNQNKNKCTPLMLACYTQKYDIIQYIIKDCDVNITNKYGETALHIAIKNYRITELLLPYCRNILSVKDHNGLTPLQMALRYDNSETVELIESCILV
jgi:ankyrin repeat protein